MASKFSDFVTRVRAGDEQAAADLVRKYEPLVRREIRLRLTDQRLRRTCDSIDICQSAMKSFFVKVVNGRYVLDEPGQLIKLLIGIARNKIVFEVRKQRAQRRDVRRIDPTGVDDLNPADAAAETPCEIVANRELLRIVCEQLSEVERELATRRTRGQDWAEIAAEMGGTPDGRRRQLARAFDRIADRLALDN
jgi:RNA polymerase sigma factor (sigma-70 family)